MHEHLDDTGRGLPSRLGHGEGRAAIGTLHLADVSLDRAREVIATALEGGLALFDTARAYGRSAEHAGETEQLLGSLVAAHPLGPSARIVSKGGMRREGAAWIPDGRAATLIADAERSRAALGRPPDVYLLHAPDPRVPLATSVRALAQLRAGGVVRAIGLSNVSRRQLDEALEVAPIDAVELALGVADDEAIRGGVVARCLELGLPVLAHSPLGGRERAAAVSRNRTLRAIAGPLGLSPPQLIVAGLRHLGVIPVVGVTRPETVRALVAAAGVTLPAEALASLRAVRPFKVPVHAPRPARVHGDGEVVLLLGVQGSGKTDAVGAFEASGYRRLNRDTRGGTLEQLTAALDHLLASGTARVVLDNTYTTRASRRGILEVAARHGVPVRAILLETPLAQAQVNVVLRILDRLGRLPSPDELKARRDPAVVPPTALFRAARELEPPVEDEGISAIEVRPFVRRPWASGGRPVRFVSAEVLEGSAAAEALQPPGGRVAAVYGWRPEGGVAAPTPGRVEAWCLHPGGPPRCWCRPPLPGLLLWLARAHGLDLTSAELWGRGPVHRALADALGLRFTDCT